jgi:pimeloyl-ACP methyl ester carboxylesterase
VNGERRIEIDGPAGRLAVRVLEGQGAAALPAVLVHGINMSSDVWTEVLAVVARRRTAVTLDLRGHGDSVKAGPYDARSYAQDVLAALEHLAIERAHVAGISFGGVVACALAAVAPGRVASVAAVGSSLKVEGLDLEGAVQALRSAGLREFFAGFLPAASFAPGVDPGLIDRALDAAVRGRDVETVVDVSTAALTADNRDLAASVRAPALVVTGELDMTCPVATGEAMARALDTDLVVVPGRGHVLSLEDPDGLADLLERYFSRHEPSTETRRG